MTYPTPKLEVSFVCPADPLQAFLAATAARRLAWLVHEGLRLGITGVGLKDHSGLPMVAVSQAQGVSG